MKEISRSFAVFAEVAHWFTFHEIKVFENLASAANAHLAEVEVFADCNAVSTVRARHVFHFRHHRRNLFLWHILHHLIAHALHLFSGHAPNRFRGHVLHHFQVLHHSRAHDLLHLGTRVLNHLLSSRYLRFSTRTISLNLTRSTLAFHHHIEGQQDLRFSFASKKTQEIHPDMIALEQNTQLSFALTLTIGN